MSKDWNKNLVATFAEWAGVENASQATDEQAEEFIDRNGLSDDEAEAIRDAVRFG
jgi:hypothetical protein